MKKNFKVLISLLLVLSLILVGCGAKQTDVPANNDQNAEAPENGDGQEPENEAAQTPVKDNQPKEVKIELPYPSVLEKDGETVGGTLNVALVSDTPFQGVFNTFLYEDAYDSQLMKPRNGNFMMGGTDHEIVNGGYCDVEFNREAKTATYKINEDLTWSDGVPVTADDLMFCYECIAHKDYTGVRYDSDYQNVVGIEEYHKGDADTISGLKKIDEKTLEVTFKEFYPGILWGSGLTYNVEPKHYLKDIPLKDMEAHDNVRVNPLSCGPFVISNIVPGESVEYIPNPYWFGDKPKVDKIVYKRTGRDTIVEALKSGTFDVVDEINLDSYPEYKDLSNITLLSDIHDVFGYVGFKLGKYDEEAGQVVMNENCKLADVKLRQAIAYAMDNDQVAEVFYNGLRISANALIDPGHARFWNNKQAGYNYDPEKAKQILNEAGYLDVDGDGMREDPEGNKLQINFLSMSGGDIAEPLAQFYIQCWNEVGLDVQLQNGRLMEFNAFYDMVQEDDPDVELYMAAWQTGSNPDPSGLWGREPVYNYTRFASEENDKLLAAIASEKAFKQDGGVDDEYLINAYHEWQQYASDQVIVAPTHYRVKLSAVNNRVTNWDARSTNSDWDWDQVGLLSDTPEKAK